MKTLYFALCIVILTLTQVRDASSQRRNTNPASEIIDKQAFKQRYSLADADVIRYLTEIENANETGGGVTRVGESFVPIRFNLSRCEDGPVLAIHQQYRNVLPWPPLYGRTCTGLFCRDPWCLALRRKTICRWAIHYTIEYGIVKFLGMWRVCYVTHFQCDCRKCEHIRNIFQCIQTKPCPNGNLLNGGFCYWRRSRLPIISAEPGTGVVVANRIALRRGCDCCYPVSCIEPRRFNRATCQCECIPRVCRPPQVFNPRTCMCDCREIRDCPRPLVWNPDTCMCECNSTCLPPKVQDPVTCECNCSEEMLCNIPPHTVLNYDNCECECPSINCTDPKLQNPTTCQCECPDCPLGSIPDNMCNCIGNCTLFHGSDYCEMVHCKDDPSRMCTLTVEGRCECSPNSCEEITDPCRCNNTACPDNNSLQCRFYHDVNPITGRDGCQCNDGCCKEQPSAPEGTDCSIHDVRGADSCNFALNGSACVWRCDCSDIDDPDICLRSSCINFPGARCTYSNATGCVCPRCCSDHPNRPVSSFSIDCSVFDAFGEKSCNTALGPNVCQWSCPCNAISNREACIQSSCIDGLDRRSCRFNTRENACFCN